VPLQLGPQVGQFGVRVECRTGHFSDTFWNVHFRNWRRRMRLRSCRVCPVRHFSDRFGRLQFDRLLVVVDAGRGPGDVRGRLRGTGQLVQQVGPVLADPLDPRPVLLLPAGLVRLGGGGPVLLGAHPRLRGGRRLRRGDLRRGAGRLRGRGLRHGCGPLLTRRGGRDGLAAAGGHVHAGRGRAARRGGAGAGRGAGCGACGRGSIPNAASRSGLARGSFDFGAGWGFGCGCGAAPGRACGPDSCSANGSPVFGGALGWGSGRGCGRWPGRGGGSARGRPVPWTLGSYFSTRASAGGTSPMLARWWSISARRSSVNSSPGTIHFW
jgi:hypothetical protein